MLQYKVLIIYLFDKMTFNDYYYKDKPIDIYYIEIISIR